MSEEARIHVDQVSLKGAATCLLDVPENPRQSQSEASAAGPPFINLINDTYECLSFMEGSLCKTLH